MSHPLTLSLVKKQLKIDGRYDDALLKDYIASALSYAEGFQGRDYTGENGGGMSDRTKQGLLLLISYWYDSRDGVSRSQAAANSKDPALAAVENLLYFDKVVHI